jgi:hypothetical protein
MKNILIPIVFIGLMAGGCRNGDPETYEFRIPGMVLNINGSGEISRIGFAGKDQERDIRAMTSLANCEPIGRVRVTRKEDQISFRRKWVSSTTGHSCMVTNRFSPGNGSIHWVVEVAGLEGPWTTPIETRLIYPDPANARIWTAWGDPRLGEIRTQSVDEQSSLGILPSDITGNWTDPLQSIPFVNDTVWFGAPPYRYENPRIGFIPFQGNLFSIPLVSILEEKSDTGVSLVLSPEDTLLDLNLRTLASGELVFSREYHRISAALTVRFAMDIVAHEAGWRGGLRWMTANYPEFFDPNIPLADEIAGTGAYSSLETAFDLDKMKKMAFGVNWKASFDFPYMGMFLPPVESDTVQWARYGGGTTSIKAMSQYASNMKKQGFHVLSYFNVTEFGAEITDPAPPRKSLSDSDLWKSADDFLYYRLADAILAVPASVTPDKLTFYPRSRPQGPYFTWGNGIILDPGEPVYRDFLIDQAARHIKLIPDAEGICIDRMDWLRMYNEQRDDSISWFGDQPTRSLLVSWRDLLSRLGPLMHQSGKVIFINNHDKRIDLLRQTDGFFDEFTYGGSPLNLTALMGVRRPVLGWTSEEKNLRPDPDAFFQRYLHLGVYPMAPFPGNDHSLLPGEWVDRQYLDYGPMLQWLKGKKWVLEPGCIAVLDHQAKVNLFTVPGGWVVPVTFGPREGTVTVLIGNVPGMTGKVNVEAMYPGEPVAVPLEMSHNEGQGRIIVPLRRGCAMVRIVTSDK